MHSISKNLISISLLSIALGFTSPAFAHKHAMHTDTILANDKISLTDAALRDLWIGHAFWVRAVVTETMNGNSVAAAVAEKETVNNAKQLAASIEPFYGKAASETLFKLLAGHYTAVKGYLIATQNKNETRQNETRQDMIDNVEQIAAFLSKANPNLPIDALRGMLLAHGGHHIQQIQQVANQQYAEEAQTWEAMKTHMVGIADALTVALAKQFPAQFK
ncbi:hypothetical protein [Sulfurirhabdus autotrophica]|uniref:Uncharacterized protein n=1 Tax=Sulfurirhabdus autotrophica TaxID=1706046 RepID=A0A4R3Y4T2_9PROT|nr:hypothetical protein [Sulfurirhabdus autotrophica]TCV86421.1 hypothetical protein EDC63_107109 [Sulfurirhabdus autotrophica]